MNKCAVAEFLAKIVLPIWGFCSFLFLGGGIPISIVYGGRKIFIVVIWIWLGPSFEIILATIISLEFASRDNRSGKVFFLSGRERVDKSSCRHWTLPSFEDSQNATAMGLRAGIAICAASAQMAVPETITQDALESNSSELSLQTLIEARPDCHGKLHDEREIDYTYMPLSHGDIRLLQIKTASLGMIDVTLSHVPLVEAQHKGFHALSYTWGHGESSILITVDGQAMMIRPNLARTLVKLHVLQYKYLWVDAICTNQSDPIECSAEVIRMRSIYAGAEGVLVATATGATSAGETIGQLLSLVEPTLSSANQSRQLYEAFGQSSTQNALLTLFRDEYWSRIWIIQEFTVGRNIDLLLGDHIFAARRLEIVSVIWKGWMGNLALRQFDTVYDVRRYWQKDQPYRLLEVLLMTANSACKKRHDCVFGIFGLCPDALKYLVEPNYETDLATITNAMIQAYITRTSLDIILLAQSDPEGDDLPSWTPNLFSLDRNRAERRIVDLLCRKSPRGRNIDRGIRKTLHARQTVWHATLTGQADVVISKGVLKAAAVCIGTIRSLGHAWDDEYNNGFPIYDRAWKRSVTSIELCRELYFALLQNPSLYNTGDHPSLTSRLGYTFLRSFLSSHDQVDIECNQDGLSRWIRGNRAFFTGNATLEHNAEELKHPFRTYFWKAWNYEYYDENNVAAREAQFKEMPKTNMRLMYVDNGQESRIGWAATKTRLFDEVFLIPGCSRPVVLRRTDGGQYKLIGDAIVIGAMEGEIWERVTADRIQRIEII